MMNQSEHRCVYRLLTNERSLGDHVVEDVEGLGVSAKHQGAANHVQAVDRQRLSGDQAGNGPIRSQKQMDISQSEAS